MALKTELEYEDLFGDLINLLTGLNRDNNVRPMKQANGTRMAERIGTLLKGFTEKSNFCTYHVKFEEQNEEPFTGDTEDKVFAKRFLRVEYNFYGPAAANNALMFKQLHYTQKSFDQLNKDNIVYSIARENTLDMDQEFNSKWWTRRNISISYLEDVEIEFPAGIVEEVVQTDVDIQLINDIAQPLDELQLIDNRDSLVAWQITDGATVEDDDYILQVNDNQTVRTPIMDLKPNTYYTILINVKEYTGTLSNSSFGISWLDNPFEFTDPLGIIIYSVESGITTGVTKTILKTPAFLDSVRAKFAINWGGLSDQVKFRAALVEGIHNSISDIEALKIIDTIDYGPTNP